MKSQRTRRLALSLMALTVLTMTISGCKSNKTKPEEKKTKDSSQYVIDNKFTYNSSEDWTTETTEPSKTEEKTTQKEPPKQVLDDNKITSDKSYGDKVRSELTKEGLNSNLILQNVKPLADVPYGWGTHKDLGHNGCAIVTLAMAYNSYNDTPITPIDVLDWSGDNYFTDYGTSWEIFPDFANHAGMDIKNLGTDMNRVLQYLENGQPVIVSVQKGKFTDVGHIMLLTHYKDGDIRLLDPNDTSKKKNSLKSFSVLDVQEDALNYWVISK